MRQIRERFSSWELSVAGVPIEQDRCPCLHELFEAQADIRPDAVAIVCDRLSLSYGELEARSNRLAHHLRALGVGPGTLAGVQFDRSEQPIMAILACLKAGGGYVPIDPSHPDERIGYVAGEAEIAVLLTEQAYLDRAANIVSCPVVALDACAADIAARPSLRLSRADTGVSPDDLCYVIYTSGTTGRPKGVMTAHASAAHFVTVFNDVCITTPEDRIYQGFPLGFDGSVEEIWMAFSNGAALVVGTRHTPRFGNDLARYLAGQRVSYLSTVPTMLSTMTQDVPSLRQLVVSGEVCSPELVARWARPGRRMLNVYGPTEATVNTTAAVCEPGQPVTIGRPLNGYATLVLDADMRPLPAGERGELYVGGIGLARGYLKQPELTARNFVTSPHDGARLYRTGDLACINHRGEIEYSGRIDDQVKIRGYRVELSEIEAVLREQAPVAAATVRLHERNGLPVLAAYVVLDPPTAPLDRGALLAGLRARLPAYMVPAYLDALDALPTLASGKVDRKRLPEPATPLVGQDTAGAPPATHLEAGMAEVWAETFGVGQVGTDQDFFLDLGGHSLLAAQMVTKLRSRMGMSVAVRDVYAFPTIRQLAAHCAQQPAERSGERRVVDRIRTTPGVAASTLQALAILFVYAMRAAPLVAAIPVADAVADGTLSWSDGTLLLLALFLLAWPSMLALAVAAKWLIIGRYRAGAYPLWGRYYLRWWLVGQLQAVSGAGLLAGTPLMPVYYRLMGARVGRCCALDTAHCSIWDLVAIGDDTSIGADTQMLGYRIEDGWLLVGRIDIGSRCFVGVHSALGLDVRMGDESRLDDQSLLHDGEAIAAGEHRRGSPARPDDVTVPEGVPVRFGRLHVALFAALQVAVTLVMALLLTVPALALVLLNGFLLVDGSLGIAIIGAILSVPILTIAYCLWIALLKALWLRRAAPGVHRVYSLYYLRHWTAAGLMRASRGILLPVFTTLYLPPWMRLLGARIGAYAEMSTIWSFIPELLVAGDGSFFADGCILGGRRIFGGRFELRVNRVGSRTFVGNSAILPAGASLGDRCLLGVLSAPPSRTEPVPDGTDWLGSPPFRLPNRQKVGGFDERVTFRPSVKLYLQRAAIDACRVMIPGYVMLAAAIAGFALLWAGYQTFGLAVIFALSPLAVCGAVVLALAMVIILKWSVMGAFKPVVVPLWCPYVWLNEMINGAYESVVAPALTTLLGTPFAAPVLRLLGCRVGRHCYLGTTLFSEFDLVDIGDRVALNAGAVVQTHLFEDRIMKSSYLKIGNDCTVGNMAVVLYDGVMEPAAVLGALSLLMKGEVVPAGSRWHGIPTIKEGTGAVPVVIAGLGPAIHPSELSRLSEGCAGLTPDQVRGRA